jgi:purine nucleosidase
VARKVIIDCDPGIDDTIALCMALYDPALEVLAITATEGCVAAEQATKNLQLILANLDPPRFPRIGYATPAEMRPPVDTRYLHGDNGLGNADLGDVSTLHHGHAAYKVITDLVRAHAGEVTLIALGPLTNIATAFQRDPSLIEQVDQIVMMGGSVNGIGNITASAEFNIYYDPISARSVFRSLTTKTLVPLDITGQVTFGIELLEQLPSSISPAGRLLKKIMPFFFNAFHQRLGQESVALNDAIALMLVTHPDLFKCESIFGDVETTGDLTRGMTIFDRRPHPETMPNMALAVEVDADEVRRALVAALKRTELT